MKISEKWHKENKMPNPPAGGANLKQRIEWHIEHAKNCAYRSIPSKIQQEIKKSR